MQTSNTDKFNHGRHTAGDKVRRVSPVYYLLVFGVCIGLVNLDDPLAETVLYPQQCPHEALPK